MRVKARTLFIGWAVIIAVLLWAFQADGYTVDLHGGTFPTKDMSIWELHRYKSTTMMRKSPLKWEPFRAYLEVDRHVHIDCEYNQSCLTIDCDLVALLKDDASFNKRFAKAFKVSGSVKHRVRQIYRYCSKTVYVPHVKTARQVFTLRQGDCAGIASAFYVLCKAKGIPVRYVIGWTRTSCHAWNRVKIKGKWYWVDCTQCKWLKRKLWKHYKIMEKW